MKFTTLCYVQYANGWDEHVQCDISADSVEQAREKTVQQLVEIAQKHSTTVIHMAPISVFPEEEPRK